MGKLIEFLQGKKTELQSAAIVVVVGFYAFGVVAKEPAEMLIGILGAGTMVSLGARIKRTAAVKE